VQPPAPVTGSNAVPVGVNNRRSGDVRTLVGVYPINRHNATSNTAFGRIQIDQTFGEASTITGAYRTITIVDVKVELLWIVPPSNTGISGIVSAGFAHTDVPDPSGRGGAISRPQAIMVSYGMASREMTLAPFPDLSRYLVSSRRRAGQVGLSVFWGHSVAPHDTLAGLAMMRVSVVVLCRGHATV